MSRESGVAFNRAAASVSDASIVLAALAVLLLYEWPSLPELLGALPFMLAVVLLASTEIRLLDGDTVDTDMAVVVASSFIYGPTVALGMVLLSRVFLQLVVRRAVPQRDLGRAIAKRAVGIWVGAAALGLLPSGVRFVGREYLEALLVGLAYATGALLYAQVLHALERSDSVTRLVAEHFVLQKSVIGAEISAAALVIVMFEQMGGWALAPAVLLAVIARQSFSLLLDIRHGYQATTEALIGAMEAQRPGESGMGGRVANLARLSGAKYGWFGGMLETLGYAALLSFFGFRFSVSAPPNDSPVAPLLDIEFLRPVAPILEAMEGGRTQGRDRSRTLVAAYIVSLCVAEVRPDIAGPSVERLRGRIRPREEMRARLAVAHARQEVAAL